MKNLFKLILPAALLVLAAGCAKDIDPDSPLGGNTVVYNFIASFEDGSTRTAVGDPDSFNKCDITWKSGDKIRWVFNTGLSGIHNVTADCDTTRITIAEGPEHFSYFHAVYAKEVSSNKPVTIERHTQDSLYIKGAVTDYQNGSFNSAHVSVARALVDTLILHPLHFKTVVSIIKFTLNTEVDSVLFYGLNGETICGSKGIKIGYDGEEPVASAYGEPRTTITINTANHTGDYFISLLPVTFTKGFKFVLFKDGLRYGYADTSIELPLARNQLNKLKKSIDAKLQTPDNQYTNLSVNLAGEPETANCYIVPTKDAQYRFRADIKGNGVDGNKTAPLLIKKLPFADHGNVKQKYTAEVLFSTRPSTASNFNSISVVSNVSYQDYFIYFTAHGQGNAIIALKDPANNIVWSWHIWVWPDYNISVDSEVYYNGAGALMSRSLGADDSKASKYGDTSPVGFFYQWGRKDPFVDSDFKSFAPSSAKPTGVATDATKGTVDYAVAHPLAFLYSTNSNNEDWQYDASNRRNDLWSSTKKTAYDPCPPGWTVPNLNFWYTASGNKTQVDVTTTSTYYSGLYFVNTMTDAAGFYPAAGFLRGPDNVQSPYLKSQIGSWWLASASGDAGYRLNVNYSSTKVYTKSTSKRHVGANIRCQVENADFVSTPVSSITLNKTSASVSEGKTTTLKATVLPANAADKVVSWTSSNTSVATVTALTDSTCRVSGITAGTAIITATAGTGSLVKTATCTITVQSVSMIDLSEKGTANCYIVNTPGKQYKFKATVKGNSTQSVGNVSTCSILWQTYGNADTPSGTDLITNVSFSSPYCTFKTPASGTMKNGNVVIAAKDASGKVLWSWHIWVSQNFDPDDTAKEYYNDAGTMMDRNLGASVATVGSVQAIGLLYQWGRKDPFPGPASFSPSCDFAATKPVGMPEVLDHSYGTVANSILYPEYFIKKEGQEWLQSTNNTLWGTTKTIYDPCPYGWKVPYGGTQSIWAKASGQSPTFNHSYTASQCGHLFTNVFCDGSTWYPYGAYIQDGTLFGQGAGGYGYYWTTTAYTVNGKAYVMRVMGNEQIAVASSFSHGLGGFVRCMKE